jgi:hypothetical protein
MKISTRYLALAAFAALTAASGARADENLFGYVKGAETLPKGTREFYQILTNRSDKGQGTYNALDTKTELEYGVTDKFTVYGEVMTQSIDTHGLIIDGYLPKDNKYSFKPSAVEVGGKYRFLSAAVDPIGLSATWDLEYAWIDPHSGQDKTEIETNFGLQAQKYYFEGQGVLVGNLNLKAGHEKRKPIDGLDPAIDWPTTAEMEIEVSAGTGYSYRFAPDWFIGAETLYQAEYETEVDLERWSLFAGPSLHYGGEKWWGTLTWFHQLRGGGEKYAGQTDTHLHLIEKTKDEVRLKIGYNF